MNINQWHPVYQEIAKLIGVESTIKFYQAFRGEQLAFPKRLLNKESEAKQIYLEYENGKRIGDIAIEHEYSERSVRRILSQYKE